MMTDQQKRWLFIAGGVVAAILVVVLIISAILGVRGLLVSRQAAEPDRVYLPMVVDRQPEVLFLPAIFKDFSIPTPEPSDLYRVSSIDENDLGTFVNVDDESMVILAECIDPGWPSPEVGAFYRLKEGLLSPVVNNETGTLQRFEVSE